MKIAIVDDEQHCTDSLLMLLKPYQHSIERIETFCTVDDAVKGINLLRPDILFLDVHLHDSTGFDVLQKVAYLNFGLIFTTAYEQYAISAFKFSAIDYLLKPIDADDLDSAMQKAFQKSEKDQLSGKVSVLLSHLVADQRSRKISIPTAGGYIFLKVSEIIRCQSDVNYTHIFAVSGKKYTVSKTLKHFEDILSGCNFFRVHNSHLINLDYIKKYTKGKGGFVTLSDNTMLEVSTRRKEEFLRVLTM